MAKTLSFEKIESSVSIILQELKQGKFSKEELELMNKFSNKWTDITNSLLNKINKEKGI